MFVMRTFIATIILIFSFQSLVKADDIRDFQIEGVSIGDSLLNLVTGKKIQEEKIFLYPNKKYASFNFFELSEIYDTLQFSFLNTDKNFTIEMVSGGIQFFDNDIENCFKKQKKIISEISKLFSNTKLNKKMNQAHFLDKSGKSKTHNMYFELAAGDIVLVACYDWSKKFEDTGNYFDFLRVVMYSKKFSDWLEYESDK